MEIIQFFLDLLRDPRQFIADWINTLGPIWVYVPLWLIIFAETGLVVTPFLPGDSLIFAAGVFAADGGGLNLAALLILLILAAVLGNTSNYWIGRKAGQAIINSGRVKSLTPKRIEETQRLFDKYGLLAIVVTRFIPIVRTFAPFLAGVGNMHFLRFALFNIAGGVLWVSIFTLLGYFFGGVPFVQEHFEWVIIAIVVISFLPIIVGAIRTRLNMKKNKADATDNAGEADISDNASKAENTDKAGSSDKADKEDEADIAE